ncbi:MAG: carbamoyltransferase HypF [Xanthomonadales bacterium]|nr:carbamoyltransferase HypF [Xanthomonadales bacterium]
MGPLFKLSTQAREIVVTGRVQGVGYRPFVYVTAHELGLTGSVLNGSGKVFIHAEGTQENLDRLEDALVHSAPPLARPQLASSEPAEVQNAAAFEILASDSTAESEIHVPPDLYTCDDCVAELTGPTERRFGYPFINCTQCGPRYTIITAMPYDRPNTSMADFPLCDDCRAEYESPLDRRFHAQPLACPACGPQLEFVDPCRPAGEGSGRPLPDTLQHVHVRSELVPDKLWSVKGLPDPSGSRIVLAVESLGKGEILAVKGVGGYHLVCDAGNDEAVRRLRDRKHRPDKPLAVMFPVEGEDRLDAMRACLDLDEITERAITDPARPIVLARKRRDFPLSEHLAPGLNELGVFLPYSPLHHQLLLAYGKPIVATSGNISGEPVITDNEEAQQRLGQVADAFLHHNRPIVRPADDPVIRPMAGAARAIRLGRGIAPLERSLGAWLPRALLATGGHLKVTVALAWDERVVVSPHIGELDSPRSNDIFKNIINDIQSLYDVKSQAIVCDLHPGYASSRWAEQQDLPLIRVQHHAAHASSLAGEHPDIENWLVFTWDGVGYGNDGTLWGGEALAGRPGEWNRVASFRPFRLVGGDKAGREPWRSAAALHWEEDKELSGQTAQNPVPDFIDAEALSLAHHAWQRGANVFETSAVGRLFDAAAALVLDRSVASFEGQGPMELEQIAQNGCEAVPLPISPDDSGVLRSDWAPLLPVLGNRGLSASERAGIFHETLAQALMDQAMKAGERVEFDAVGLSGGVFQNRHLAERVVELLTARGIAVRLHREIPANDGGLSFGQIIEAAARETRS